MPIYEYRCNECGEKFEKLVRLSTSTSKIGCPNCGEQKVDKLISTFCARMSSTNAAMPARACDPST